MYLEGPPDELPAHGDPVLFGDRTVGQVTSGVRHYEEGPLALAAPAPKSGSGRGCQGYREVPGESRADRIPRWQVQRLAGMSAPANED